MKIIEVLKNCSSVIVLNKKMNKKVSYSNVHLVETPNWRVDGGIALVLRGDNKQYKFCPIADLWALNTTKEYDNNNGIWIGEEKYLFAL